MNTTQRTAVNAGQPGHDCDRCPRLVAYRQANRAGEPHWHNAPVPSFGNDDAWLLIVGLAPGLRGANRTGRPFTGDFAGDLLYATLIRLGLAHGDYGATPDDGLRLFGCRITNAVRCVPPANKPTPAEARACRPFLSAEIGALEKLETIAALGAIAHGAVLTSLDLRKGPYPFIHGAQYGLPNGLTLASSYHCSRLNTNTGRLTPAMFEQVFTKILADRRR
ncbi:MAG: uracil-DNA glycosylase [Rhodospirillales bacterium]|nr:uracil-DNA glycosylase [Rhodospirillales bacterium]